MSTRPSPLFSINGNPVGTKAKLAANTVYTATLNDIAGVSPVSWTVPRSDDTTTGVTYTGGADRLQSGSVGQTIQFRTAGAGTAGAIKSTVAGGIDPITGQVASALMSAEVKFFVPTAEGLEVWITGETVDGDNLSSAAYGAIVPINAAIRATGGAIGAYKPPVKAATSAALPAYTRVGNVITANAVGAFSCDALMTWAVDDTFLLHHGASGVDNDVYALNVTGDAGTACVATRVWWMDESAEVPSGCLIPVVAGATYADEVFQLTTNNPIVINTTSLSFSLWAGHWDRTGTVVHPEATGDTVAIGASTMLGTEKLRVVGDIAVGSGDVATVGTIRLPDAFSIYAWGTGPANVPILTKDASDTLVFGNTTISLSTYLSAADNLQFFCGATQAAFINATAAAFKVPITYTEGAVVSPVDGAFGLQNFLAMQVFS